MFNVQGGAALGFPNALFLRIVWVSPVAEASDYDPELFQQIIDACTGCTMVGEVFNEPQPLSVTAKERYLSVLTPSGRELDTPYERLAQQTSAFPSANDAESIIRLIDNLMPAADSDYVVLSQISTAVTGRRNDDTFRSLGWPKDVLWLTLDYFYFDATKGQEFYDRKMQFQADLTPLLNDEDHRVHAFAFNDPDMSQDWPYYFESEEKFRTLQEIKACVDPDNTFEHRMSVPLPETAPPTDTCDGLFCSNSSK